MKKQLQKLSSILLCFVMLVGLLPTTAFAADTTTIDTINIKGITAPVAGATPDASGVTTDTAGIKIKNPTWRDSDGRYPRLFPEPVLPYTIVCSVRPLFFFSAT